MGGITITLRSGGSIRLNLDVNLSETTPTEREFVLSLISKLADYPHSSTPGDIIFMGQGTDE